MPPEVQENEGIDVHGLSACVRLATVLFCHLQEIRYNEVKKRGRGATLTNDVENLSSYKHAIARIRENWATFQEKRSDRLAQQSRYGVAAEKVAENIVEDLFTEVLDWSVKDLNNQIGYADILLSQLGIKYLLIETKRPGALAWNRRAVSAALDQALRYAAEQKVKCVAVSDGVMLYAADIAHGGLLDRIFVDLESKEPPETLWWLSVHGVYRDLDSAEREGLRTLPEPADGAEEQTERNGSEELLHPKHKVPARCFAYVGNAADVHTWHLPYRLPDGAPDTKHLAGAISAILGNYRGARVTTIPESDIPGVLVRLAKAAHESGKMPGQSPKPADTYVHLEEVLRQLGRLSEVID